MKRILCVLAVFFITLPVFSAIDTREIESLRQRLVSASSTVSAADEAVIAKFWRTGLDRMFLASDPAEVVEVRKQLTGQKGGENLSFYATAYIAEAFKDLQVAFETVERIENPAKKALVDRNLMILAAEIASPKLAPLALQRFGDEDEVIRYWAVKAVTQPAVIEELTRGVTPDPEMTEAILKGLLEQSASESVAEIQKKMIVFAGAVDHPLSQQMLTGFADKRIEAYKNWTVTNESLDIPLLNALGCTAVSQSGDTKSLFGQKFAELYSLVIQRYMKGQTVLPAKTVEQLIAVIAEVDQSCVSKSLEIQTGIVRAIQRKTGLEREYDTLFGNRMMAGELALKLRFDYGKDASGKALTAPPELSAPPVPVAGN
jgi:hypothetical protein